MSHPTPDICWQAVQESDAHYDGLFVVAVKTTGIYCRPSCPARLPKRENVLFFPQPDSAEAQGFRPCKRCQPQHAPVNEQAERVQAICDYIEQHLDEALTLEELGAAVAWNPQHLQRIFKHMMGITPRQYAQARRIERFKEGLKAGESVTNAALDAGYSSSSRVYEQSRAYLGMTPSSYQKGGGDATIAYSVADSPLGLLLVARTERGLCALEMGEDAQPMVEQLQREFPAAYILRDDEFLQADVQAVLNYLNGWQPHLDLPLDLRVTAFQQRVMEELCRIPYGETRTYGEIARAIGKPNAARAVGNVCNKNPVPLVVPCHRVVGSTGKLTGYAFGLHRKQALLDLEQGHAGTDDDEE